MGRIDAKGVNELGYATYELRYLPYGETMTILSFLQSPDRGVLYRYPVPVGLTPAAMPPPPIKQSFYADI